MDHCFVESVTASLVREYLSRKGLKMTLQMMDEEMPREENSISNRMHLKKVLHIDKIMNKNKESESPLKAMLEVMSKSFIDKAHARGSSRPDSALSSYPDNDVPSRPGTARSVYPSTTVEDEQSSPSSSASRLRPVVTSESTEALTRSANKKPKKNKGLESSTDLVIEDDVDGETLLGDGRAGLLSHRATEERHHVVNRSKLRGMSGPISSNTDELDRKSRMGRTKHQSRPSSGLKKVDREPAPQSKLSDPASEERPSHEPLSRVPASLQNEVAGQPPRSALTTGGVHDPASRAQPIQDVLGVKSASRRPRTSRLGRQLSNEPDDEDSPSSHSANDSADEVAGDLRPDRPRTTLQSAHWRKKDDTLTQYGVSKSCIVSEITAKPVNFLDAVNNTKPKMTKVGDLEFGDVDDLDSDVAKLDLRPRKPLMNPTTITDCRPIDIKTASELKKLCLGSASSSFNDEWSEQAYTFCEIPQLTYGIVQKKGGPCGILAAVQACVLQQILFCVKPEKRGSAVSNRLDVDPEARTEALALALALVLWRAGDEEHAVVTIPSGGSIFTGNGRYRPDNLTETLVLNHFKKFEDLSNFLKDHVQLFEEDGQPGVVLTLYSTILSRTIDKVRADMDESEGRLMGQHGYCTQELVNLILSGQAASNTFNDYMLLDGMKLRGLSKRSNIGFLSLFEHYKSCEVGTYFKTPKYPIWVVCSESHFSVLFCTRKELMSDWRVERRFDLHYYDGLANQDEPIRLTVVTSNKHYRPPSDEDLIPPLELCIRTKWAEAEIDWNGTEPLL